MRIQLSGCAVINKKDELLLLWKKKHGHYEFPGGKVEPKETLSETAIRECKEELGVDVVLGGYVGYEDFDIDSASYRSHKYLGYIQKGQLPRVNEKEYFEKMIWLPIKRYKEYSCAPNVKEFSQNFIEGKIKTLK